MRKQILKDNYRYIYLPIHTLSDLRQATGNKIIECEDIIFHPHPRILKQYIPADDLILEANSELWNEIKDIRLRN